MSFCPACLGSSSSAMALAYPALSGHERCPWPGGVCMCMCVYVRVCENVCVCVCVGRVYLNVWNSSSFTQSQMGYAPADTADPRGASLGPDAPRISTLAPPGRKGEAPAGPRIRRPRPPPPCVISPPKAPRPSHIRKILIFWRKDP